MSEAVVSEDSPNKDANMYDVEEDSKDALTSGYVDRSLLFGVLNSFMREQKTN